MPELHVLGSGGPGTTYKMSKKGWHALDIDVLYFSHHPFDGE